MVRIFKKIICFFISHNFILKNKITSTVMEVKCTRCNKEFGINTSINALIELDDELIDLHKTLKNEC